MDNKKHIIEETFEKCMNRNIQMALLAIPSKRTFCISEKNIDILNKKNNAILNAFQKIKKAEVGKSNFERLNQLDNKICTLQSKGNN